VNAFGVHTLVKTVQRQTPLTGTRRTHILNPSGNIRLHTECESSSTTEPSCSAMHRITSLTRSGTTASTSTAPKRIDIERSSNGPVHGRTETNKQRCTTASLPRSKTPLGAYPDLDLTPALHIEPHGLPAGRPRRLDRPRPPGQRRPPRAAGRRSSASKPSLTPASARSSSRRRSI